MGIISALLTGGTLIGKVCQTLSGALSNIYVDELTGVRIAEGDLTVAGVRFFQSSADGNGMSSYAFNSNPDYDVTAVFPNDVSGNGLAYDIPATKKVNITADLASNNSPNKEMLIGPSCASTVGAEQGAARVPVMKLSLNNMKIGGEHVTISDYDISCDTAGIKIKSGTRALGNMIYIDMHSDRGVMLSNQSSVEAGGNDSKEYSYKLDLGSNGLKEGDCLSGQIHVEMADNLTGVFRTSNAEPLHEAEERYFRKQGILK